LVFSSSSSFLLFLLCWCCSIFNTTITHSLKKLLFFFFCLFTCPSSLEPSFYHLHQLIPFVPSIDQLHPRLSPFLVLNPWVCLFRGSLSRLFQWVWLHFLTQPSLSLDSFSFSCPFCSWLVSHSPRLKCLLCGLLLLLLLFLDFQRMWFRSLFQWELSLFVPPCFSSSFHFWLLAVHQGFVRYLLWKSHQRHSFV